MDARQASSRRARRQQLKASIGTDVVTVRVAGDDGRARPRRSEAVRRLEGVEDVRIVDDAVVVYVRDGSRAIAPLVLAARRSSRCTRRGDHAGAADARRRLPAEDRPPPRAGRSAVERRRPGGAHDPRSLSDTCYLMMRALRETIAPARLRGRQNIFIPLFFFAVTVGAIGDVSAKAFGVDELHRLPDARRRSCRAIAGAASVSSASAW